MEENKDQNENVENEENEEEDRLIYSPIDYDPNTSEKIVCIELENNQQIKQHNENNEHLSAFLLQAGRRQRPACASPRCLSTEEHRGRLQQFQERQGRQRHREPQS